MDWKRLWPNPSWPKGRFMGPAGFSKSQEAAANLHYSWGFQHQKRKEEALYFEIPLERGWKIS